jgi:superfamily II DNA or RNA helicase
MTMCLLLLHGVSLQVGSLHGELQPSERGATLEAARNGAFRLLLVSDLAARGLDLPQVRQYMFGGGRGEFFPAAVASGYFLRKAVLSF